MSLVGLAEPRAGRRGDIQVLRALAVTAVLVYHLWPDVLPGGFVGVDVFFVISGFLIGSHLLDELYRTGTIRLGRFWSRRAARLLPASLLVLAVVAAAVSTLVPLSRRGAFLEEILGSTFYVQNWVLAGRSVDYLAADDSPSPVQHYWTLSTEEQFYLALPVVLLVAALVSRRSRVTSRQAVLGSLLVLALGSLAYSAHLTAVSPGVAYFSTATRAWEFLAGALLGAVAASSSGARAGLGWVGLGVLAASLVLLDGSSAFPGLAAAWPVVGAVLVLRAGDAGPLAVASRWRPLTWWGDVSYAAYLWHWPLVVLVPYVTAQPLDQPQRWSIVVATVVLAWASTRWIETPVRFSPLLLGGRRPLVVGTALAAASVLVGGTALAAGAWVDREQARAQVAAEARVAAADPRCLGAAVMVPTAPKNCPSLGDELVPAASSAALDDYNRADCWAGDGDEVRLCSLGDPTHAPVRVLAVGDSHNNVYLPWYESLVADRGWAVDVAGRSACAWIAREQDSPEKEDREGCDRWKAGIEEHLARSAPYDLIITTARQRGGVVAREPGESLEEATTEAFHDVWTRQVERGSVVVAVRDNPEARADVVECVERELGDAARACAVRRDTATPGVDGLAAATRTTPGTALLDPRGLLCGPIACRPVIGDVIVYRDSMHLTATFVRTMSPILSRRLDGAWARARYSVARAAG